MGRRIASKNYVLGFWTVSTPKDRRKLLCYTTLKTKAIQSIEISEAVYQSTRPEHQMFGIFIKTAVRSSKYFISATVPRQRKNQEKCCSVGSQELPKKCRFLPCSIEETVRVVTCSDYQFCASYNLFSSSTSTCH
jgi:hypothetical protein